MNSSHFYLFAWWKQWSDFDCYNEYCFCCTALCRYSTVSYHTQFSSMEIATVI